MSENKTENKFDYERLSKRFGSECVERTSKFVTKKGYDTTGIGYQFIVNRLNEIYGERWGFIWDIINVATGEYRSGQPYYEITVCVGIWILDKENLRKCVGGHIASTYTDALKGAITNAFKKTAAFWGVGKEAYEGTIDDDTIEPEERADIRRTTPPANKKTVESTKPYLQYLSKMTREGNALSKSDLQSIREGINVLNLDYVRVLHHAEERKIYDYDEFFDWLRDNYAEKQEIDE